MKIIFFLLSLSLALSSCGQSNKAGSQDSGTSKPDSLATPGVEEYLGVYGPFQVGEYIFHLSWSSHPTENYYKQEYIPPRYDPKFYIQMVLVELALGDLKPKEAMENKIKELEGRKPTDPHVKYTTSTDPQTGDPVLEFMLSINEGSDGGIVEWNVYRYIPYKGPSGKKGLQLFGYSRRGYGVKTMPMLGEIERDGAKFKANFMSVPVPPIKLK